MSTPLPAIQEEIQPVSPPVSLLGSSPPPASENADVPMGIVVDSAGDHSDAAFGVPVHGDMDDVLGNLHAELNLHRAKVCKIFLETMYRRLLYSVSLARTKISATADVITGSYKILSPYSSYTGVLKEDKIDMKKVADLCNQLQSFLPELGDDLCKKIRLFITSLGVPDAGKSFVEPTVLDADSHDFCTEGLAEQTAEINSIKKTNKDHLVHSLVIWWDSLMRLYDKQQGRQLVEPALDVATFLREMVERLERFEKTWHFFAMTFSVHHKTVEGQLNFTAEGSGGNNQESEHSFDPDSMDIEEYRNTGLVGVNERVMQEIINNKKKENEQEKAISVLQETLKMDQLNLHKSQDELCEMIKKDTAVYSQMEAIHEKGLRDLKQIKNGKIPLGFNKMNPKLPDASKYNNPGKGGKNSDAVSESGSFHSAESDIQSHSANGVIGDKAAHWVRDLKEKSGWYTKNNGVIVAEKDSTVVGTGFFHEYMKDSPFQESTIKLYRSTYDRFNEVSKDDNSASNFFRYTEMCMLDAMLFVVIYYNHPNEEMRELIRKIDEFATKSWNQGKYSLMRKLMNRMHVAKKIKYARATFEWVKGKGDSSEISEEIARKPFVDAMITIVQAEIMKTNISPEDIENAWKQWIEDGAGPTNTKPKSWGQSIAETADNIGKGAMGALNRVRSIQHTPGTGAQVRCLTCGLRCHPTSASMGTLYRSVQKQSRKAQLTKEIVF
jgi:hypothetical protein